MGVEGIGASVVRKEDKRFITGKGRYVDDIKLVGMTYAQFIRSPHAHAKVKGIDTSAALKMPGVIAVLTGAWDFQFLTKLSKETCTDKGLKPIDLQPREFRLLEYLLRHAGQVVTRMMLLQEVWDFHFDPRTTVVETHMSRLRAKVDREFATELIHTVRGQGYSINARE